MKRQKPALTPAKRIDRMTEAELAPFIWLMHTIREAYKQPASGPEKGRE